MNINSHYKETLKSLRGEQAFAEVAKAIGYSESAVRHWETGLRTPDDQAMVALAKYYNKTVEDIFFGQEAYDTYAKRNPEEK